MRSAPQACPHCEGIIVCAPGCDGPHAAARADFLGPLTAAQAWEAKRARALRAIEESGLEAGSSTIALRAVAKRAGLHVDYVAEVAREVLGASAPHAGRKALLTPQQEAEVARRRAAGEARADLAREYGVSPEHITVVCQRARLGASAYAARRQGYMQAFRAREAGAAA